MIIKIDAFDTLFFRDGKPFTMGAETWGSGIFPPYPSMIYGALRSAYFSYHINKLLYANTDSDPTKNLKINCICLRDMINILFPAPMDCVKEKGNKENVLVPLKLEDLKYITNCKTEYILKPETNKEVENLPDAWIDSETLKEYLSVSQNDIYYKRLSEIVLSEPKIGIGRNNFTKTAEDTMLYRVGLKRLKDASIIVDFEGLDLPNNGIMKVGGEGRPVYYSEMKGSFFINVNFCSEKLEKIKLYLATPAIFEKGWLPDGIDENSLQGEINGIELKLLTCAIGKKSIYIGGFDIGKKEPKSMKRAIPAGSVYYFKILRNYESNQIINNLHNVSILKNDNYRKQGFGVTYLGRVE